ncbi:MAG: flagellar biosynthesis protein FlhF [Gemmatimonadaceae bacterium]
MQLEAFRGRDLTTVFHEARRSLGDDAMILHSHTVSDGMRPMIEVLAAAPTEIRRFHRLLATEPPAVGSSRGTRHGGTQPFHIALVGPTGAGKTTTAAKLAVHAEGFGGRRVGFLALDTYRAGAIEQLQGYADVAEMPLEVVYDASEVPGARRRLASCEVIIVDTPGRGPRDIDPAWRGVLHEIRPAETHLVVPATMRLDLAAALARVYAAAGVTHALLTKLDEVPKDAMVAQLAGQLALPMRWVTDGQNIPVDLHAAGPLLLEMLDGTSMGVATA